MIETLLKQFAGSGEAGQVLSQLQGAGLNAQQAQGAVQATAEGAAQAAQSGDLLAMLGGGGGVAGMLGGLLGGGGLAAALGGGGAPAVPAGLADTIAQTVSSKTGLSAELSKTAVNIVLPKIVDFVKSKMG